MSLDLDLSNVQENAPIPDGTYPVVINKSEVSPTRSGGLMIKITMKITGDVQCGRMIFDMFNIENANPQAVQIGLGQLRGMMKAFGHPNPNMLKTTDELLGLKGSVVTKTVDDGGSYGPQTRVRSYKALSALAATQEKTADKTANPFG